MFGWKILLTTLILLFGFACNLVKTNNSTGNNSQNTQIDNSKNQLSSGEIPNDLLITLGRTACYGTCPIYKLTVKADGSVLFEGEKFTKTVGKAEGKISEIQVKQLIKEFENVDYFNLNGKYDSANCYQITDSPSAVTSIQFNGKQKSVDHYYGCQQGSDDFEKELAKLKNLENKIDEIVETKRWIGERK
ncbi:hypothetical protein BH10ACI1_BH10ACI1_01500 [soil metagenome]